MAVPNSMRALNKGNDDISKADIYSVSPHLLEEEEGFNTRGLYCDNYWDRDDVKAGIRALADAYKRGDYVPPIIVRVREGRVLVREGHRRRRALLLAVKEGADIKKVQVHEHKGDETEQTLLIATSNDGAPLTPLERAVVYGRLSQWGWSDKEIAERVGRTAEHVRQARAMLEMPLELKKLVQNDVVSATLALDLYREHGETAVDMVKSAASDTDNSSGEKKKVTKQKVAKNRAPRIDKKTVEAMTRSVTGLIGKLNELEPHEKQPGTYTFTLNKEEVEQLLSLKESLAQFSKTPEADREPMEGDGHKQDELIH